MLDLEIYADFYEIVKEWENDEQAQVEYHEWLNGLDN